MARIRTIKPEFWESPDTAAASPRARLLYIAMWNWADDYGVGKWTERELLAFAFPNDHDVTVEDFPSLVKEVADCFGTTFYVNRGRRYYAIPAWDKHQKTERRAQGKYPTADDTDSAPDQAFSSVSESVGSSAVVLGSSSPGKGTGNREEGTGNRGTVSSARGTRLSDSWMPSEDLLQWARAERTDIDPAKEADAFRDYWLSQPGQKGVKTDWDRTFKNWIRNARAKSAGGSKWVPNTEQNLAYLESLRAQEQSGHRFEIEGAA